MTTILFYNSFFDNPVSLAELDDCERQYFTHDRSRYMEADTVVFHLPSLGEVTALQKRPQQMWALWSMESAVNYPYLTDQEFLSAFDIRMTYETNADIWTPYLPSLEQWERARQTEIPEKQDDCAVVLFQSSDFNRSGRLSYLRQLMGLIDIDSYGKALNNKQLPSDDLGTVTKHSIIKKYKFCIAMENSICSDYVTEKFFDPLLVGSVPIYLGAPNIVEFAPSLNSYIDVMDYKSPQELADYIRYLSADHAAYQKFYEWRREPLKPHMTTQLERARHPLRNLLRLIQSRPVHSRTASSRTIEWNFDPGSWHDIAGARDREWKA